MPLLKVGPVVSPHPAFCFSHVKEYHGTGNAVAMCPTCYLHNSSYTYIVQWWLKYERTKKYHTSKHQPKPIFYLKWIGLENVSGDAQKHSVL